MSAGDTSGIASKVVAQVDRELRAIWEEPDADPNTPRKARVCMMNLVVVGGRAIVERYTPVVDEVTRSVPSRAILVALAPEAANEEVNGDGSAVCTVEGGKQVCSERVRLYAGGAACARIATAVDALLVPEIPTSLVWLGRVHTDDPVFEPLAQGASRIVIDSEYTSLTSLLLLAKWADAEGNNAGIADLAWTRIAPWQELIARFFDADNELAEDVTSITITQASDRGAQVGSEAMLLLGWLATRLGWKTTRLGGALGFTSRAGKAVRVSWASTPRPETVAPLSLAAVAIEAGAGGGQLVGSIVRELGSGLEAENPDADMIEWKMTKGAAPAMTHHVRLGANKGAKWLERTLRRPTRDPAFLEAVRFAEGVLEGGLEVP